MNTTTTVTLGTPLSAGQSVNVNFLPGVADGDLPLPIIVEALP